MNLHAFELKGIRQNARMVYSAVIMSSQCSLNGRCMFKFLRGTLVPPPSRKDGEVGKVVY